MRETQINSLSVLENSRLNSVQSLDSSSSGPSGGQGSLKGLAFQGTPKSTAISAEGKKIFVPVGPGASLISAGQDNTKSGNLQEQLMSDEIQQIYASRLHFQQKIKWFYGLLTTSSLNRHIYPYNSKRGLRSKKLMGLSFLSELERRLDILLYRLSLFPTIASARQAIQHKRIRI